MKIMIIECNAEELRTNRTILDSITDVINNFAENLCGVRVSPDQIFKAAVESEENNEEAEDDD